MTCSRCRSPFPTPNPSCYVCGEPVEERLWCVGGPLDGSDISDPGDDRTVHVTVVNSAVSRTENLPARMSRGSYVREDGRLVWKTLP